jgi:hypothetical protein
VLAGEDVFPEVFPPPEVIPIVIEAPETPVTGVRILKVGPPALPVVVVVNSGSSLN